MLRCKLSYVQVLYLACLTVKRDSIHVNGTNKRNTISNYFTKH